MTDRRPSPDRGADPGADAGLELALPGLEAARVEARRAPRPQERPPAEPAPVDPVARVLVDVPLAHLDRPFDYLVTADQHEAARPGVRVKVRFAGQRVDGFVLERVAASDHEGRLQPLLRVVGAEPVLTPEVAELTARVAHRWAGTRSDVLRLAVPPRHATVEKQPSPDPGPVQPVWRPWAAYAGEPCAELAEDGTPRVVWSCLPGDDWAHRYADAVAATLASGRGALVCVPDRRDVDRVDAALRERLGAGHHVVLTADLGPAERYRSFLALSRGAVRCVVGTRAAAFAPVADLGLVAIWDDGDDLHAEPRAPYSHTREVLLLRAQQSGTAVLVGSFARSAEADYLVSTGWARACAADRAEVRRRVAVSVAGASDVALARDPLARSARIPSEVHHAITAALESGPVLVQTPRAGYALSLACDRCRTRADCPVCHGPLRIPGAARAPVCAWCATAAEGWTCAECGGHGLRAPVLGDQRTAEELGRAHPGVLVRTSSGERVLDSVPDRPAIVVATTGAEPVAEGGYAAVCLLDAWILLAREDLRAEEEAVRRWSLAAGLVRPPAAGGRVVMVGDPAHPAVQTMVRWDPAGFAARVVEERLSAHLPPASRLATVTGPAETIEELDLALPAGAEVLGPVPVPDPEEPRLRLVVRVPRAAGDRLSQALGDVQRQRSARKLPHLVVRVDPLEVT